MLRVEADRLLRVDVHVPLRVQAAAAGAGGCCACAAWMLMRKERRLPTRLETRTKESNKDASKWVANPLAQRK